MKHLVGIGLMMHPRIIFFSMNVVIGPQFSMLAWMLSSFSVGRSVGQWSARRPLRLGSVTGHSQFIDRRITVDAPSLSAAGLPQQPVWSSTPLTQLCFFQSISIDTERRTDTQKKTLSTKRQTMRYSAGRRSLDGADLPQFTHRLFITFPTNEHCCSSADCNYR